MAKILLHKRVLGVLFLSMLVLGVWVVNGVFTQKFTTFEKVTVKTDRAGLNLPSRADVKVRGVLVGQVLDAKAAADGVTLTLGIEPDRIDDIPADVTASLIPKTLFGEKYVSLDVPQETSGATLQAGAVIEKTKMPAEVEQVLNDIYPLLRAVQPAELNYTLNALATALEGRGEDIGENIETLNSYLTRINPQVPKLMEDLRLLSTVSNTYADVLPQLARTLRNTVKTGGTLVEKEEQLRQFLRETSGLSDTAKAFLDANGKNIVRLGELTVPQVRLLEQYSETFPCLLEGIVNQAEMLGNTFRGFVFHINLKVLPHQPRKYDRGDVPVVGGVRNAPSCFGLPNPQIPVKAGSIPNFDDNVDNLGKGDNQRPATGFDASDPLVAGAAGTEDNKALFGALTAPVLGVPVDEVPDVATLLFGPLAAGTEVSVR